jgi:hypothetical protein
LALNQQNQYYQSHKGIELEIQYLPSVEYFVSMLDCDQVIINIEEPYRKQTHRNRCKVLTANKVDTLTVPVKHWEAGASTASIEIDYTQPWVRRHLGCLRSAYGKSPYFEYYFHEFEKIYAKNPKFLVELNYELLTICLRLVGIKVDITYNLSGSTLDNKDIFDAKYLINNKKINNSSFFFKSEKYYQTFGNDFVSNLSIVDLIFNMGPESKGVLTKSRIW